MAHLVDGGGIDRHENLLVTGPTGLGKSWIACALGHKACRDGWFGTVVSDDHGHGGTDPPIVFRAFTRTVAFMPSIHFAPAAAMSIR